MSDMIQKRDYVNGLYSGPGWKAKVRRMTDAQVIAIYLREHTKEQEAKHKQDKKKESNDGESPF